MKKIMILLLAAVVILAGCASPSLPSSAHNPRAPQSVFFSRLERASAQTYYVSFIPALFTEPDDLRTARHRNLALIIKLELARAGLVETELPSAELEVLYTYSTRPDTFGDGFSHKLDITISRNRGRKGGDEDRLWEGVVWADSWPDQDIAGLFPTLVGELLSQFPKGPADNRVN